MTTKGNLEDASSSKDWRYTAPDQVLQYITSGVQKLRLVIKSLTPEGWNETSFVLSKTSSARYLCANRSAVLQVLPGMVSAVIVGGWDSSVGYGPVLESRLGEQNFPKSNGSNPVYSVGIGVLFQKQSGQSVTAYIWGYTGVSHHGSRLCLVTGRVMTV
jgi:hypothetical protein